MAILVVHGGEEQQKEAILSQGEEALCPERGCADSRSWLGGNALPGARMWPGLTVARFLR